MARRDGRNQRTEERMTDQHPYAEMDRKYREGKAAIRADGDLTYEAKERRVKALTDEHYRKRGELERQETERLAAETERAYRKVHGPGPRRSADEETARELRLARIRAEVTDAFDAGRQDPIRAFEMAVRAGDAERAEVIGTVGPRYLDGFRRARLAELVRENEPEDRKRARRRLEELEKQKQDHEVAVAISRRNRDRMEKMA